MQARENLRTLAERLGTAAVDGIGRIGIAAGDEVIPMLRTVVLRSGGGYVLLRYEQAGLSWGAAPTLAEMWPADDLDDDEVLEVVPLDGAPAASVLPRAVTRVSGLIGVGPYEDVLSVTLHLAGGTDIVLVTSDEAIEVTTADRARQTSEAVAAGQGMTVEPVSLLPY